MKIIVLLSLVAFLGVIVVAARNKGNTHPSPQEDPAASFYENSINFLTGEEMDLSAYKGKYILCVNVASKCGYTPQYEPLQSLYDQYQENLVIIGFPCNQFLGQEPGSAEDIATFCEKNYGVTFPMTEKIKVKGNEQHPIYAWLTQEANNGVSDAKVSWNFNKFLISPEGKWLAHFSSKVDPLSDEITSYLK